MIRLVGLGPGGTKHITLEAVEIIKRADVVIAFARIAKTALQIRAEVKTIDRVDQIVDMLNADREIAILASGDPCFYGILDFLQRNGIAIDQVVPGISSIQYMMARLKKSWHSAALLSFHGRECSIEELRNSKTSIVLTDSSYTPNYISRLLSNMGVKGKIFVGYNLSYEDELIIEKQIGADIDDYSALAVVVIENEMD
ncbi:MAG: precorrin-6y C5,15-methyltransferase (decarboxylating) subunit CbiE [Clostridiales bacterium GWB2_37_7]|nr:MAG: precorrin-6y C5,15-methyltransferase (decarboxylating) subunit CbiE [Clostridiales bacterium GWB2_37_7]